MTASNDFQNSVYSHENNSHPLTKKIHHGASKDSFRHKLGAILESRWADIFILCVVMIDIGLLTVEHGIDSGMFCIDGERMPAAGFQPGPLAGAGELPGALPGQAPATLPVRVPEGTAFVVPAGYDLALRPRRKAQAQPPPAGSELPRDAPPGPHGPPQMIQPAVLPPPGDTAPHGPPQMIQPAALFPPGDSAAAAASRIAAAYPGRVAVQGGGGEPPLAQRPELPAAHLLQVASQVGQLPVELRELRTETAEATRLRGHPHTAGPEMVRVCEPREGHYSHQIEHWAHVLSVALLSFMFLEILLKLWVHPAEFMRNPLEVLDLFIVSASLFTDAILLPLLADPISKAHAEMFIAILLICRIWRVARILHGIVQVVMIQREHSLKLYERIKVLEKKEGELEALQAELQRDRIQAPAPDIGGRRRS